MLSVSVRVGPVGSSWSVMIVGSSMRTTSERSEPESYGSPGRPGAAFGLADAPADKNGLRRATNLPNTDPVRLRGPFPALIGACLLAGLLVTGASPSQASTPSPSRLPFGHLYQVLGDPDHARVFVTGGPEESGVSVVDSSGDVTGLIDPLRGASGMVIFDGALYVATSPDAIAKVDLASLAVTDLYPTDGPNQCPKDLGVAGGRIWFGGWCGSGHRALWSLDPGTGAIVDHSDELRDPSQQDPWNWVPSDPVFAVNPADLPLLVVGGSNVSIYDVSTPTVRFERYRRIGGPLRPLLSPDGGHVAMVEGATSGIDTQPTGNFRIADLARDGGYRDDVVAASPDGSLVLGTRGTPSDHQVVDIYRTEAHEPSRSAVVTTSPFAFTPAVDLAFADDEGQVVGVTKRFRDGGGFAFDTF